MLREIGGKLEMMEKLSPKDILIEVHEAAEELQMKIDQNSYILVNYENWQAERRPKEFEDLQNFVDVKENENKNVVITSLSESFEAQNPNLGVEPNTPERTSSENVLRKPISWPRLSFNANTILHDQESKVYESASSLTLATFTSLLIEFVARLQNIVDEFEELSKVANFKEPKDPSEAEEDEVGVWTRLLRSIGLKKSKPVSVGSAL